jgi:hypothetical protein
VPAYWSFLVKTVRIWLLIVAAFVITAPLGAEEINAPEAHWRATAPVVEESATVNWARVAVDADDIAAHQSGQPAAATPESGSGQASSAASSVTSPSTPQTEQEKSQREKAAEQIKEQEKQRVLGVVPSFNVSYRSDAVSLTGWQKMRLAFRSSVDPVTFATAFLVAGYHEAANDVGFQWGIAGYGQRAGAAYLDSFNSNMIGNGILPALLHQDPRYFRLGHGSTTHRLLYATATAFICRHDNTGKWEPNYSNVLGNVATGAISNLYYPGSNSGVGLTISNGLIVTAEGAIGSIFQEFWPDISRKLLHKDPTHGLDAQSNTTSNPAASGQQAGRP